MWWLEITFWVAAGLIGYTLIGYPLLSLLLAATFRRQVAQWPITPKVSLIIAAYNEEAAIEEKIRQSLALDYPREQIEIMVASDGSTDRTDEIVRSFADQGVRLYQGAGRKGKTNTLNGAVAAATGEIIVFSDATGVYNPGAIRALAANFADPRVGCVAGRVAYRYGGDVNSEGFKGYQKFAVAVRRAESRFGSQTSVSGSIHAIRRSLFRPAHPAFSLDVIDAVHAAAQGYRVVYEDQAVSLEHSRNRLGDEFRCRVRISVRGTSMIPYVLRQLIGSRRFGYTFQMISHKILRWWLWLLLLVALTTNLALVGHRPMYLLLAGLQVAFYGAALFGLAAATLQRPIRTLSVPTLFVVANAAMGWGAMKALFGRRMPTWEPVRDPLTAPGAPPEVGADPARCAAP